MGGEEDKKETKKCRPKKMAYPIIFSQPANMNTISHMFFFHLQPLPTLPSQLLFNNLDLLDQNLTKNLAANVIGICQETAEPKPTLFQPYMEAFGLQRFRECELIHGRWAMLGTLGAMLKLLLAVLIIAGLW